MDFGVSADAGIFSVSESGVLQTGNAAAPLLEEITSKAHLLMKYLI